MGTLSLLLSLVADISEGGRRATGLSGKSDIMPSSTALWAYAGGLSRLLT